MSNPKEKEYFIVNPGGAVHGVTKEHARERLKQHGFRMARPAEVKRYKSQKVQTSEKPIAPKFTTDPDEAAKAVEQAEQ